MKKIVQLLYMLFAVAAFSACSDGNQGEVVSQDLSYQLDANCVSVDIPEKSLFDPFNILYLGGKTMMELNAKSDRKQITITEGIEFTFNVKSKKALSQNVKVRLKKNLDLLEEYTLTEFPDEAFELNDAIMTAGSREGTVTLNITNPDILNKLSEYVLPFRLELVDTVSGVKISKQSYSALIEMNLELEKDNIDPSNDEITGKYFNNNVVFESNKNDSLEFLYDGKNSGNTWYPNRSTFLTMTFPKLTRMLGVRVNSDTGYYSFGSSSMYTDKGNGFISYGKLTRDANGTIYLKFKEPVDIRALKFDGMLTTGSGTGPDIYEITFIKQCGLTERTQITQKTILRLSTVHPLM